MGTTKWVIDPTHSEVTFKVKHMMISSLTGHFKEFKSEIETSNDEFTDATFSTEIQVDSIQTKNEDRDTHLKSEEFFGAEEFPLITFKSTEFKGDKLTGDLTIKGITKSITFDTDFNGVALDPYGQTKAGFEFEANINRKEFGLTWSAVTEAGNIVVSDKIKLIVEAQFIKQ